VITVFLTREFREDEINQGWWSGKWYGRGVSNIISWIRYKHSQLISFFFSS
jgi:hypothetical protein